ncbi:MAG: hypothetical protein M0T84_10455 [Betaproteobacteria bacterium]|nr:hypothetical protein [Betaproteobacteria bacterium]
MRVEDSSKKRLLGAALSVSFLSLLGYLGFLLRDLFMVRTFGAGNQMDTFYLGAMVPMFFVSVLSMPVGTALIPIYSELRMAEPSASPKLMGALVVIQVVFMGLLAALLHLGAPIVFSVLGLHYPAGELTAILGVMDIYLVIMLVGGVVIVANAVLNAEGWLVLPALAQLAVPIVVMLMLVAFGASHGIYAAVYGMLLGQVLNLMLVSIALHGRNLLLPMLKPSFKLVRSVFPIRQYGVLVVAALSTALFAPLANTIAGQVHSAGSVAIIGMGIKVIMFFTGTIGIGLTTVLLPYFSNLAAKSYHLKAQADLSFFLLLATLITVPLALVLRLLAATITYHMVAHSAMTNQDVRELIRTIQYGVAQLPFFACSLVAVKYITAYQRAGIILVSSLVGLVLTVWFSRLFIGQMGVSGISLAMTIALMFSTAVLVAYINRLKQLPVKESLYIFANWILFALMFGTIYYHLAATAIGFGVIYLLFAFGSWRALIAGWSMESKRGMVDHPVA